jgi:hypothetical protein
MYCSNCGTQIADHLNYCNSCGARNEKNALVVSNASSRGFAVSAGVVGAIGLIGFVPLIQTLLGRGLDAVAIIIVALAYLATVLTMFMVLVGHVWKRSGDIHIKASEVDDYSHPRSFRGINTNQLEEPRQQPISVTDNTTRTLDGVAVRRD